MSNNSIVDELLRTYGVEDTMLFCNMTANVWEMKHSDELERGLDEPLESEYEYKWWREKYEDLQATYLINE